MKGRMNGLVRLFFWLVIAGVTVACGPAPTEQDRNPMTEQDRIPIKVALGDVETHKVPFMMAADYGLYEKHGLDADVYFTTGAADFARRSGVDVPEEYVKPDEPDILISGGTPLTVSVVTDIRNWDRVILATTDPTVHWQIIARPEIESVEQLKGKRIGFSGYGSMTHYISLNLCKRMGWDPVYDVSLMAGALVVDGLQDGRVDAIIGDNLHGTMALAAGFQPLVDLRTWNLPIAGSGIRTTKTWVRENGEAARRFVKAMVEAIALFKQEPEKAHESMTRWWRMTDEAKLRAIYADGAEMPRKPYPSVEGVRRTMEIYDSHEMRQHQPEDFYDDSFLRELDESGYIDSLYEP